MAVHRAPWGDFPDVVICNSDEHIVREHPSYAAAKAGDADAAEILVKRFVTLDFVETLRSRFANEERPIVAAVHAEEEFGRNQIASVLAGRIARLLDLQDDSSVIQSNIVNHTKADGWAKLARQAEFDGVVERGACYLLVDDFVGQGGTLANFRGHFIYNGGRVLGACVLTGKPYSAKIALSSQRLASLLLKYGNPVENLCKSLFGFGHDCLTESEARWIEKAESLDAVRNELASFG
jgi:hypoxanthine-guanine phosphoribosyltransferase